MWGRQSDEKVPSKISQPALVTVTNCGLGVDFLAHNTGNTGKTVVGLWHIVET